MKNKYACANVEASEVRKTWMNAYEIVCALTQYTCLSLLPESDQSSELDLHVVQS
jgi:hypothetical protein